MGDTIYNRPVIEVKSKRRADAPPIYKLGDVVFFVVTPGNQTVFLTCVVKEIRLGEGCLQYLVVPEPTHGQADSYFSRKGSYPPEMADVLQPRLVCEESLGGTPSQALVAAKGYFVTLIKGCDIKLKEVKNAISN